jgi:hypothetical protein
MMIDAMHIKKNITYNSSKKTPVGYVDLGMGPEEDSGEATEALVIMLVGINARWKAPISYYFTRGLSADTQTELVLHAIDAVESCGLKASIICGASCNLGPYG